MAKIKDNPPLWDNSLRAKFLELAEKIIFKLTKF
jgi:hypothetical protein